MIVEGVFVVLGACVVLLALLAIAVGLLAWIDRRVVCPWAEKIATLEHLRIKTRMISDSYWFSEDEATRLLVAEMAEPTWDPGRARERWRARRKGER